MRWDPPGPALLFCPADRADRFEKAAAAADVVILDLEDGVAPARKAEAREALSRVALDPARTIVRVNGARTPDHPLDLEAVARTPYTVLMLPKTESPSEVTALSPYSVVALCETPAGVLAAPSIAAADAAGALMWGGEDLLAALGGHSSRGPDGTYRDVARLARSQVLLAAGAHGLPAIDAVHLDIGDLEGLRAEAEDAAASGFAGTACIHPSQVETVRRAYRPGDDALAWAARVLDAAAGAPGVFAFEGQMVDAPVLAHARAILRRGAHPPGGEVMVGCTAWAW